MVISNRDRLDRAMGHLAGGLGPFVNRQMATAFPEAGQRYSLSDPRFLLRVVTDEWRIFRDQLSRVEQGFATELRDAGNRWAHGDPFSDDDTYRTLDTIERLLTAIGAADQAREVRSLRLDVRQSMTPAATPSPDTEQARPGQPPPQRTLHTTGFWSRVARADVVQAIEEYDSLGQDQFLAQHGFGRATAYLLIYRGRSYDSKAILGVAYKIATGARIGPHDFSGGVYGAAAVLRKLGFDIRNTRDSAGRQMEDRAAPGTPSGARILDLP